MVLYKIKKLFTDKQKIKIAATITVATMGSFLIGSIITAFMCAGRAVGDSELIFGYIVLYLIAYAVIAISAFGISIACLTSKKQLHHWIDCIEEENNLGDFEEEDQ